ncbi:MAG: LysR family transcriptional regulator, partial [Lentisphaerae bacterium]|nr:LysR family transcriptional regulator [Lentisphaerota bacterium]
FRSDHPQVRFHLHSGNAEDVMERLDHGILDFGILIQPVDISRYNSLALPVRDTWGLILRKDHPLAKRKTIRPADLADVPLLLSRQIFRNEKLTGPIGKWFGEWGDSVKVAGTYNLIFNAALLIREGVGCALGLDKLIDRTSQSDLYFRPLSPKLAVALDIVWKKSRIFSEAAEKFLERLRENLVQQNNISETA